MSSTEPAGPVDQGAQGSPFVRRADDVPYERVAAGHPAADTVEPPPPSAPGFGRYGAYPGQYPSAAPERFRLASWGARVGGSIVDGLVENVPASVLYAVLASTAGYGLAVYSPSTPRTGDVPLRIWFAASLLRVAVSAWNRWFRQGSTGRSLGKSAAGIRLVDAETGAPVGPLRAFLRELAHILDALPLMLGYLWPLWDAKGQTFADKIVGTIVVRD